MSKSLPQEFIPKVELTSLDEVGAAAQGNFTLQTGILMIVHLSILAL